MAAKVLLDCKDRGCIRDAGGPGRELALEFIIWDISELLPSAKIFCALYEQCKVKHSGSFPELEDQLCTYAGGGDSPDRLDALVYALSDLMLGFQVQKIPIVCPVIVGQPRHNPFSNTAASPPDHVLADARSSGFSIRRF